MPVLKLRPIGSHMAEHSEEPITRLPTYATTLWTARTGKSDCQASVFTWLPDDGYAEYTMP